MHLYVGCSGWSHDSWQGRFYPPRLQSERRLHHYSRIFDYAEIDSTFYKIPNRNMVMRWASGTAPEFRFTAKFPQVVTHDTRLGGGLDYLMQFFEAMKPLQGRLLCLLMQLPPSLKKEEGLPKLEQLIPHLWQKYRYAIEARHESWFTREVYDLLKKHRICLAWNPAVQTPPEITADFFYLRFTGDKNSDKKDPGRLQKEVERWAKAAGRVKDRLPFGIVAADNHYAGFAPSTANDFRKMIGLPEASWETNSP
jgi:uncharacterized protein YecE (DUF72 family)